MGIQRFVRTMLKPLIYERFGGAPILIVVDPAGIQRAQTDERSAVDIIKAEGLKVIPAKTNNPTARISAVDEFLMGASDLPRYSSRAGLAWRSAWRVLTRKALLLGPYPD
jgi:hypothetical protein